MSLIDKLFLSVSGVKRNLSGSSDSIRFLEVWSTYIYMKYGIYIYINGRGTKILKGAGRWSFG